MIFGRQRLNAILLAFFVFSAGAGAAGLSDEALQSVTGYKFGDSRAPLAQFSAQVQALADDASARGEAAKEMARALGASDTTTDGKEFLCEQLSLVGSDAEVPALAALLDDDNDNLAFAARRALERIPGEVSLAAMRDALAKSKDGGLRVGLINSLGERGDTLSVKVILGFLSDGDLQASEAAMEALGKIGDAASVQALTGARKGAPKQLESALNDALLRCANRLLVLGDGAAAREIYLDLSKPERPGYTRLAAFPGLVASQKEKAAETLLAAIRGEDNALRAAAIRSVRDGAGDERLTRAFAEQLPKLAPEMQTQVIGALADRGDRAALPAAVLAASSVNADVADAAFAAIGVLGDASVIPLLASNAAGTTGARRNLIRLSLARLRGADIDAALIAQIEGADAKTRTELVVALGERGARSATPTFLKAAADEDRDVRKEAVKGLGLVGGLEACAPAIEILKATKSSSERRALENALVAICRRADSADVGAAPLLAPLGGADAALRDSLLRALGKVGGDKALVAVRAALKDEDDATRTAAIKSLGEWPDAAPMPDLLEAARGSEELTAKILALRGFAALAAKPTDRAPGETTKLFQQALDAAPRPEDKKTLLGALGKVHTAEAWRMAQTLAKDEALKIEARMAASQIAAALVAKGGLEMENLALGAKASSPDGIEKDGASSGDQAAIDGDPNTYWDEENGKALYRLRIEFPKPTNISALRITGYEQNNFAPSDFDILCGDGSEMKTVATVKEAAYEDSLFFVAFAPTTCKALELKITGSHGPSPAIRELEVYDLMSATAVATAATVATPAPATPGYAWARDEHSLSLMNNGRVVWRHNHNPEEGKTYFHPLGLADGTPLTWLRPGDHVWHRAFWHSWKFINGLNYWEEDPKTGLSQGRTDLAKIDIETREDFSAKITMVIRYHPPSQPTIMLESREVIVGAPDSDGCYRVEWNSRFVNQEKDILLDRTPLPGEKDGQSYGGYAGLSVRFAEGASDIAVLDSEGRENMDIHGKSARWVDFSGNVGGVAIFDHPGNLRHPAPWYVAVGAPMRYFGPAPLFNESFDLPARKELVLRYRVLVHPPGAEKELFNKEWADYSKK